MIIDNLQNLGRYSALHPELYNIKKRIESIQDFAEGRIEINGDQLYGIGIKYETRDKKKCLWEGHKNYIDIHYIFSGEEIVEVAKEERAKITRAYDAENDYTLFEVKGNEIVLNQGSFIILYPGEIHKTSVKLKTSRLVRKLVFKLKINS